MIWFRDCFRVPVVSSGLWRHPLTTFLPPWPAVSTWNEAKVTVYSSIAVTWHFQEDLEIFGQIESNSTRFIHKGIILICVCLCHSTNQHIFSPSLMFIVDRWWTDYIVNHVGIITQNPITKSNNILSIYDLCQNIER